MEKIIKKLIDILKNKTLKDTSILEDLEINDAAKLLAMLNKLQSELIDNSDEAQMSNPLIKEIYSNQEAISKIEELMIIIENEKE